MIQIFLADRRTNGLTKKVFHEALADLKSAFWKEKGTLERQRAPWERKKGTLERQMEAESHCSRSFFRETPRCSWGAKFHRFGILLSYLLLGHTVFVLLFPIFGTRMRKTSCPDNEELFTRFLIWF